MPPIEHVFEMGVRRLARVPRSAGSKDELWLRIQISMHRLPHPYRDRCYTYDGQKLGIPSNQETTSGCFYRGRIIGKLEEGRSVTSVAAKFGIAHNIVSRLWRQFQTSGTAIRGFNESRFILSSDSHRILILRERGSRNHPSNIIERDRYGGRGVLVWGGTKLGSRTDLHIFDAGSVNGTRYCNEILLPYVRLFRGAMGLQFLFMDDNAPCHRTVAAEQLLESEDIERMDWPARSPDLNPIEHVWDSLGRRLAARTLPPVTIRELRLALQDEWAAMPQQLIDTLILSMGRRCETCLAVSGDHIPY
ncbi:transposable element Tcb2 transposase [Trichonephila clavipes]|nr:transposable element Tcb2 transposase [Trichonephila clavipes]